MTWKSSNTNILSNVGGVKNSGNVAMTLTITKDNETYQKVYSLKVDKADTEAMPVFYPESQIATTDLGFWQNFSKRYYRIAKGEKMKLKFCNHSDMQENYKNWILVACNSSYERANYGYSEYFVLRNDAFGWGTDYNAEGLKHDFDWSTFKTDMNDALVDMTLSYDEDGTLTMTSVITTKNKKVYNYSYTCSITGKPSNIKLFLTGENSYFDSEGVATGISSVNATANKNGQSRMYRIDGKNAGSDYRGIVVMKGKKVMVNHK